MTERITDRTITINSANKAEVIKPQTFDITRRRYDTGRGAMESNML